MLQIANLVFFFKLFPGSSRQSRMLEHTEEHAGHEVWTWGQPGGVVEETAFWKGTQSLLSGSLEFSRGQAAFAQRRSILPSISRM